MRCNTSSGSVKACLLVLAVMSVLVIEAQEWKQVWSDEFDYTGLPDDTKWGYDVGGDGFGNEELQYYTESRDENAYVENGVLSIKAIKESYEGNEYTSARLVSLGQGDWLYGKVEIKAKLPTGRGIWPAIWMLPTQNTYGGWPNSGEIDIMEYVGYQPERLHFTIHTEAYNHKINTQIGTHTDDIPNAYDDFHVYSMEWYPDSLLIKTDGVTYFKHVRPSSSTSAEWPFDQKFHLLLNVAVGGTWGGAQGVDDDIFPQTMEVDYVRVFQEYGDEYTLDLESAVGGMASADPDKTEFTKDELVTLTAAPDEGYEFESWSGTYNSRLNPLQVSVFAEIEQTVHFSRIGELLENSKFGNGASNWGNYGAEVTKTNDTLCFGMDEVATNLWDRQVSQGGFAVDENTDYELRLSAYSNRERTIQVQVGKNADPWTAYFTETPTLTTVPQAFYFDVSPSGTDDNARVVIDMGGDFGDVCFTEISLVEKMVLSLGDEQVAERYTCYPNPTTEGIYLEEAQSWHISNVHGKELRAGNSRYVDLRDFPSGIYFVRSSMESHKVIKQ